MTTDDERAPPPPPGEGGGTAYGDAAAFRPATKEPLLVRAVPVSQDVPTYRPASAGRDLLAGLTVAALAVPSAMAYGQLAGLSPVNGLYALLLPTVAYVLLGSSRRLVIGPEGATSTLVAAAVLPLAVAGSADAVEVASMLALLVAVCFFLAWLLRIGWIADYFSRPVLIGYLHGVAITLVVAQLGKLLGLQVSAQEPLGRLWEIVKELGDVSGATMAVSAVALATLVGLKRFMPFLPGALIVVVAAIGLSWWFELGSHGIALVGPVEGGLPRPTVPTPPLSDILELVPAAVGLFLVSFADEILTARAFAGKRREHVRASQELLTMGVANVGAGFTQTFSVGASGARTAVNDAMGVRTQLAGLFAAAAVVVILLFLTGPIQYLPQAILAAVIVVAGIGIVDRAAWESLARIDRVEVAIAGVTTACVVIFGVLQALVVAVGLSIIDTVRRSARPYDAVLGWVAAPAGLPRRRSPSVRSRDAGRRRLPARRPTLLRERGLRQGTSPRGDSRGADRDRLVRVRRGSGHPHRLDRDGGAARPDAGPPSRGDHARRRAPAHQDTAGLRRRRPHRGDRPRALLSVGQARRRCVPRAGQRLRPDATGFHRARSVATPMRGHVACATLTA